jgi:hypothetical protein
MRAAKPSQLADWTSNACKFRILETGDTTTPIPRNPSLFCNSSFVETACTSGENAATDKWASSGNVHTRVVAGASSTARAND